MATLPQYLKVLRDTAWDVALRFGVDLRHESKATRAGLMGVMATQAVLIDRLVEKGVITDQELLQAINKVRNSSWRPDHDLPVRPVWWSTRPVTGVGDIGGLEDEDPAPLPGEDA